ASASARNDVDFDPEWISGTFVIRGQCENSDCQQAVHGTGNYHVAYSQKYIKDEYWGPSYSEFYSVTHMHPPMMLMSVPQSAPDEVREGVQRASRVLFTDPGLAATALRATVERFLSAEGIPTTRSDGRFRPAHERITEWSNAESNRQPVADLFFAVKWLENAGTHEDSNLSAIEVCDGARALGEAFHRLFTGPDIDAYARTINAAKGPSRQL